MTTSPQVWVVESNGTHSQAAAHRHANSGSSNRGRHCPLRCTRAAPWHGHPRKAHTDTCTASTPTWQHARRPRRGLGATLHTRHDTSRPCTGHATRSNASAHHTYSRNRASARVCSEQSRRSPTARHTGTLSAQVTAYLDNVTTATATAQRRPPEEKPGRSRDGVRRRCKDASVAGYSPLPPG